MPWRMTLMRVSLVVTVAVAVATLAAAKDTPPLAPPFPSGDRAHWIGTPATWDALRGRVVLLDVWTFG
jgi:hypothetical protein